MEESELRQLLVDISSAIDNKDKNYVDMLKVLYKDLANVQSELEEAKSAVDLFKMLKASGILKATDISVLFETIELTGLKFLKEIIKKFKPYPDEVKITRFTAHRQKVVALGKDFSLKDLLKASQLSEGKFSSNPWKLIQHLEDSLFLTEDNMLSFCQCLRESKVNEDFNELLLKISNEIGKKDKHVDMLRVLYKDLANVQSELEEANSAFDLFEILRVADILKPTDISVLFETIELTGLKNLKKIIETYQKYPDKVDITLFSPHRQQVLALGKDFSVAKLQQVRQKYEIPVNISTNPWKVIEFLEDKGYIDSEKKFSSFLKNMQSIGNQSESEYVASSSNPQHQEQPRKGKSGISKQPKRQRLDKGKSRISKRAKRQRLDEGNQNDGESVASASNTQDQQQLKQDLTIKDSLTTWLKNRYKDFNRLSPAVFNDYHEVDIADVFTELRLQTFDREKEKEQKGKRSKAKSTFIEEGKSTSLTEVYDVIKSTESCKVLITGQGGMGKTTLLRYIAHNWAIDDINNPFYSKLLFLISIRDIKEGGHFVDILMKQIDKRELILKYKLSAEMVETFLVTHDDEIVILLDGYDEIVTDAKDLISLFSGGQLQRSTVVITSRPENVATLMRTCDVHIQVKGFSKNNIEKYIKKHFNYINKSRLGKLLIDRLVDDTTALTLCSSPLLLLQICTIWEQKEELPEDLVDLFKKIICCIINQYISKIGNESIPKFESISGEYKYAILIVGKCIYEGLKLNKLTIDKCDLKKMTGESQIDTELALKLGFVYEDIPLDRGELTKIYTTPHKLLSEALAGYYLSEEIRKESLDADADEYELIRSSKYLHMTRVFTIGFLGADAGKLLKHWMKIRASNYLSIGQCLRRVKEDEKEHVIQELDNYMSNEASMNEVKAHTEQMCESFRNVSGESYNMHLFKILGMNLERPTISKLQKKAFFLVDKSSEEAFRNSCRIIAHTLILTGDDSGINFYPIFQFISYLDNNEINIFLAEIKYLHIKYNDIGFKCYHHMNSSFLVYFLQNSPNLSVLNLRGMLTANDLCTTINELHIIPVKLKLERLDLSENNLHDITGILLRKLFEIAPKLSHLEMRKCCLSVNIVNEMLEECEIMNVELKDIILDLGQNDLSACDGKSLAKCVRGVGDKQNIRGYFCWRDYCLRTYQLKKMVESVHEKTTFNWKEIDLSETNLSVFSARTLACLLKISPNLKHINMCGCCLSGSVVSQLIADCGRMNVVLKDSMLGLRHNDLSDIDGRSLFKLHKLTYYPYVRYELDHDIYIRKYIRWEDYRLTADNLKKLLKSIGTTETLVWKKLDLSNINLSSFSGKTLASLIKISPDLTYINMVNCKLSDSIVSEMLDECERMKLPLKDDMFNLFGNQISELDKLARLRNDYCDCMEAECHHILRQFFNFDFNSLTGYFDFSN